MFLPHDFVNKFIPGVDKRGVKDWCGIIVKEILHECGLESLWQRNQVDGLSAKEFKSMVECCLYRLEKMKWLQEIEEKEKLVLYNRILLDKFMCKMLQNIHIEVCWFDYEEELCRVRKVQKIKNASL